MIENLKNEFEEIQYLIYGNIGEDSVGKNYEWDVFLKNKVENNIIDTVFYEQYQYEFHPSPPQIKVLTQEEEIAVEEMKAKFKAPSQEEVVVKSKRKSKETPEKPKRKYNKKPKENK